ncbi:PAAR domain-containing protein [Cupriavidus sp. AcVe19-6a]|uniref:PAAR domain-containing protein n=1 Tax=Cupriavidus sp. AcVe19-6a TaxID=2821358 RepID=UPI001AE18EC8|nr:PAAR domain-containing protein [Cupriavidus sp. AcVe19-6a]
MADIRYPLKNGDKTSTVGILIATGRSVFHHGTTVGVEGDYASCPACKSGGEVRNDCYPAFDFEGKQILVSGARVYCGCSTHPIVLPSQGNFTVEVNRRGAGSSSPSPHSKITGATESEEAAGDTYDEQVRVVDGNTHAPIACLAYYIETSDDATYRGYTDADGRCERVSTERPEMLTLYLGDDAEIRMEGKA